MLFLETQYIFNHYIFGNMRLVRTIEIISYLGRKYSGTTLFVTFMIMKQNSDNIGTKQLF